MTDKYVYAINGDRELLTPEEAQSKYGGAASNMGTPEEVAAADRAITNDIHNGSIFNGVLIFLIPVLIGIMFRAFKTNSKGTNMKIFASIVLFLGVTCIGGPLIALGVVLILWAAMFFLTK